MICDILSSNFSATFNVLAITAKTAVGAITILSNHCNIVSELAQGAILLREEDGNKMLFNVSGGFISFSNNKCSIVVDNVL
jgi:F0F1-type ATP synthase epsilon subunit